MPDPISLTGSPGQPMTATQLPNVPAPKAGTESVSSGSAPKATSQAVARKDVNEVTEAAAQAAKTSNASENLAPKKDMPDKASVEHAAQSLREFLKNLPSNLEVHADKETGIIVYKVVNPITNEVLRQYPPDEMVELSKRIKRMLTKDESGILLDRNL